jgi:hypothetical protein
MKLLREIKTVKKCLVCFSEKKGKKWIFNQDLLQIKNGLHICTIQWNNKCKFTK